MTLLAFLHGAILGICVGYQLSCALTLQRLIAESQEREAAYEKLAAEFRFVPILPIDPEAEALVDKACAKSAKCVKRCLTSSK